MYQKKPISYFVVAAFLLFGLGQCLTPLLGQSLSAKEKKCCAAMHCSAAMKDHDCCKRMSAADDDLQYRAASSISIPVLATPPVIFSLSSPAKGPSSTAIRFVEAPQHAPPLELYTLNQSFLI